MNLKSRLSKLEESASILNKPVFEMSDDELERFMCKELGLAPGTPITDDMLLEVAGRGAKMSRYTHEEALDMLN
jgi:hypothetical protein